jgi:hypothetical protein
MTRGDEPLTPRPEVILETSLSGIPFVKRGKVRDLYDLGEHPRGRDGLDLRVDVVLLNGIPGGKVLCSSRRSCSVPGCRTT